jgi:ligand-binding SRPBCC domain-containing protein
VQLRFEQVVAAPREVLFEFHLDPANLALLLSGWKGFELVSHDGRIRPGSRVRVRQRVGPFTHQMTFEHTVCEPPHRFGERQIEGPFARFEHVHEFTATDGGTIVVDRVDFELPWHFGGALAERWIAAPELRRFFAFRRAAYGRLVESGRWR